MPNNKGTRLRSIAPNVDLESLSDEQLSSLSGRLQSRLKAVNSAGDNPTIAGPDVLQKDIDRLNQVINGRKGGQTPSQPIQKAGPVTTALTDNQRESIQRQIDKLEVRASHPSTNQNEKQIALNKITALQKKLNNNGGSTPPPTKLGGRLGDIEPPKKTNVPRPKVDIDEAAETLVKKDMANLTKGRKALLGVAAAVVILGAVDIVNSKVDDNRAKKQQEQQRVNQTREDNRAKKYRYAGTGYQPETFENFVQDMFNMRTGHHKMGNSKFI